ncbi:hypothetical protein ACRAKI_07210 [Saccharothrix isguenensis]
MLSLKTEGFVDLVAAVAERARLAGDLEELLRIAITLDGRMSEETGRRALTSADRVVVDRITADAATVEIGSDTGDRLYLTGAGRLVVRTDGAGDPVDLHLLGALRWQGDHEVETKTRRRAEADATAAELAALHSELAGEPVDAVHERIDRIEYAVVHMAPVLLHVDDRVYTNLGKGGNLPGKSMGAADARTLLNRLRATPVAEWSAQDACFIVCLNALLLSGPAVRAEEFNGAQLTPSIVDAFLVDRLAAYGGRRPRTATSDLAGLDVLARECARLRAEALAGGQTPYRVINGLNMQKVEHLMPTPDLLADVPAAVGAHVEDLVGAPLPERISDMAPLWKDLAKRIAGVTAADPFTTAFESVLHGLLTVIAEAFAADVTMSRGPERFDALRSEPGDVDPLKLGTGDFYCCVTPREAFVDRFGDDRAGLAKTLAAYSARMRFNTWHYLPHTLGIVEREPGRTDWFFAPTMPDVTEWSDQHHTGHVVFGVRHAIRVPFGIDYDGRDLPGLYDLRLMRTSAPSLTVADLRGSIAAAALLKGFYQAMSEYEPTVADFGRDWYQRFYG